MRQIAITECHQRAQKITHVPTAEARGRRCRGTGCSPTFSFGWLRIHASGRDNRVMASASDDFNLTMNELRAVVRFAAESAQTVLAEFEADAPDDIRPREALTAALAFAGGAPRTNLLRTTAFAAHRAAKRAPT
ncbi:putative immunity protein [Cryobacterium luteum]|uniref:putative immunity protein n=1 Tax=Cryobacterium luteum TaxID=1424661 RepID=UPI003BB09C8D